MINIKFSSSTAIPPIKRQTPDSSLIWKDCRFFVNEDIKEADYWFVFDNIFQKESLLCPSNHVFLCTGEPPSVRLYPANYTRQFYKVLTCQKNLLKNNNSIESFPHLPWMAGAKQLDEMNLWDETNYLDYHFFCNNFIKNKLNKVAIITSNKRLTKGHRERVDFVLKLKERFSDVIDLYGNGFSPIMDKYDVLSKYKYSLVIENCIYPTYWTEKLSDAYLCQCYPFYIGAPNIYDFFSKRSLQVLDLHNIEDAVVKISTAMKNDFYGTYLEDVILSKSLILNNYNLFARIHKFVHDFEETEATMPIKLNTINMPENSLSIRIQRRMLKYFNIEF